MAASTAWAIWRGSFRARTTRRAKYMGPCAFARKIVGWGATFNSVCWASTTTPTISTGLGTVQQTFSFLPTGFWPAKNRSACVLDVRGAGRTKAVVLAEIAAAQHARTKAVVLAEIAAAQHGRPHGL